MTTITSVPPHNLEAERSGLGAILLTGQQALESIALEEHLEPEHFYRDQHALSTRRWRRSPSGMSRSTRSPSPTN